MMQWLRSWLAATGFAETVAVTDDRARPRPPAPPPPARPSAGRRVGRPAAALVAPADRDAHRDRAALPARAGRRPRLAAAAAVAVAEQRQRQYFADHPDAGAGARPAVPVRRLQLAVVRRGLPAAVHLADRLRAAARARARPRAARRAAAGPAATCCGCPTPARWRRRCPAAAALDVVEEELRVRRFRVVRARRGRALGREGLPQGDRQPAVPPLPGGAAARPGRRQAVGLRGQHPGHRGPGLLQLLPAVRHVLRPGRWSTAATSPRCASTSRTSGPSTRRTSPRRRSPPTSATAPRARRAGRRRSASTTRCGSTATGVYVTGHGFSPTFTVTRPDGTAFTDVSVPFLPVGPVDDGQRGRAQAARPRRRTATTSWRSRASSRRPAWCRAASSPRSTRGRWRRRSRSSSTRATSGWTPASRSRSTRSTPARSTAAG